MTLLKNLTQWQAPSGEGYFESSGNVNLTTVSGVPLLTVSGKNLIVAPETYSPKYPTLWTNADVKSDTLWQSPGGATQVVNIGTENITDNLGNLLTDNLGNFIVTTPSYNAPKSDTQWTPMGAS